MIGFPKTTSDDPEAGMELSVKRENALLHVENLNKQFKSHQRMFSSFLSAFSQENIRSLRNYQSFKEVRNGAHNFVSAVDGVSFSIEPGECVGLVGESGSGKTTLARLIARLIDPTDGRIWLDGEEITALNRSAMRSHRKKMRMMFQSPGAALNPFLTIKQILTEAIRVQTGQRKKDCVTELNELLEIVSLPSNVLDQCPGELSGGLQRRVSIARTIVGNPKFIIADEPVGALDASIQAQIINLMRQINKEKGVAYLLISHDLSVIRYLSDRILVMYRGRIVEEGSAVGISSYAMHPYTMELMRSSDYDVAEQEDGAKSEAEISTRLGCSYRFSDCPIYKAVAPSERRLCETEAPEMREVENVRDGECRKRIQHRVACHYICDGNSRTNTEDKQHERSI